MADNSLREVDTHEGIRAVLQTVHRHLEPDGRLLVTERRFDPSRYPDGVLDTDWSEPLTHPATGDSVRRRVQVKLDAKAGLIHGLMTYRTVRRDGRETTEECTFDSPVFEPADYHALFAEAGFDTDLYVGYEDRPDDGQDPTLCFVGRRGV